MSKDRMGYRRGLVRLMVASLMGVFTCRLLAQQSSGAHGTSDVPENDRSFYTGRLVTDPEGLSGLWEASNDNGGAVGIHLTLFTSVAPDAKGDGRTLAGVEQHWQHLEVDVYERHGPVLTFGEANAFSDDPRGAGVTFENGRLQLHFVSAWEKAPSVDLDLRKQPDDRWKGRLHRGRFDAEVTLRRPGAELKTNSSIKGTWATTAGFPDECVHVVEQVPSVYAGWADILQIAGRIRFAPSIQPHPLLQIYGQLIKVEFVADQTVSLEFGAYSGICCPRTVFGKISADGKTIEGARSGSNNALQTNWKKMASGSCIRTTTSETQ